MTNSNNTTGSSSDILTSQTFILVQTHSERLMIASHITHCSGNIMHEPEINESLERISDNQNPISFT